jgi:hypothetical protein
VVVFLCMGPSCGAPLRTRSQPSFGHMPPLELILILEVIDPFWEARLGNAATEYEFQIGSERLHPRDPVVPDCWVSSLTGFSEAEMYRSLLIAGSGPWTICGLNARD